MTGPSSTSSPTAETTTTITTTTPEPLAEDYLTSIVRMRELAFMEESMVVEMHDVIKKFGSTKVDFGHLWHNGLLKIKT